MPDDDYEDREDHTPDQVWYAIAFILFLTAGIAALFNVWPLMWIMFTLGVALWWVAHRVRLNYEREENTTDR